MILTREEERTLYQIKLKGWKPYRNGWPDFLVDAGDNAVGIEVKKPPDDLNDSQKIMFRFLELIGIKCYVAVNGHLEHLIHYRDYKPEEWQPEENTNTKKQQKVDKLFKLIKDKGGMGMIELRVKTGMMMSRATLYRYLEVLENNGKIEWLRKATTGSYVQVSLKLRRR